MKTQHFAISWHYFAIGKTIGQDIFFSRTMKPLGVKTIILADRRTLFGCGLPQGLYVYQPQGGYTI
jgi:hypothetical protein